MCYLLSQYACFSVEQLLAVLRPQRNNQRTGRAQRVDRRANPALDDPPLAVPDRDGQRVVVLVPEGPGLGHGRVLVLVTTSLWTTKLMHKAASLPEVGVGVVGVEAAPRGRARSQRVAPPRIQRKLYLFNEGVSEMQRCNFHLSFASPCQAKRLTPDTISLLLNPVLSSYL